MGNTVYTQLLVSGIIQIVIGGFCLLFAIVERVTTWETFTSVIAFGIWMGLWICITGILGTLAAKIRRRSSSKALVGVYMGFSIVSIVFAATMIIAYSLMIGIYYEGYGYSSYYSRKQVPFAMSVLILTLSILEFGVGIWSSVCCCVIGPCCGTYQPLETTGQALQPQGIHPLSYVIVQGPDGTPVAVPAQASGAMMVPCGTPGNNQQEPVGMAVPPHYQNFDQPQQVPFPSPQNEVKVAI